MPVQALVGSGLWVIGGKIEEWLNVVSVYDIPFKEHWDEKLMKLM